MGSLAFTIDRLREAANEDKAVPLRELEALPCQAAPACELKQLCVQAYRTHLQSLKHLERAREVLRTGSGAREQAVQLLQVSETELQRALEMTQRCVALQGQLAREYL